MNSVLIRYAESINSEEKGLLQIENPEEYDPEKYRERKSNPLPIALLFDHIRNYIFCNRPFFCSSPDTKLYIKRTHNR